jgi:hypothetical protein
VGISEYARPYLVWTDGRGANAEIYYAGSTFIEPVALKAKDVTAVSGAVVGADPASISSVDDVSVVVPAGACSYDVRIAISEIKNPQAFAMQYLGSYDFGPSGMQFNQPVTVTIPYAASSSGKSALAYWYNSLTGLLSQQGITDVENLVISSDLYALRCRTTHFTPFYLLLRQSAAAPITKCVVRSGKTPGAGQDSIQLSGVVDPNSNDLAGAAGINVEIKSITDNRRIYSESISFDPNDVRRGQYSYKRRLGNGQGGITLFQLNLNRKKFVLEIKNIDLASLRYPISIEIEIGRYVAVGRVESRSNK